MGFLLAIIALAAAFAMIWRLWRRRARRFLAKDLPESFIIPSDPAWSLDHKGNPRERVLDIPSAVNLRDIGGYPAAGNKRVKWGVVYRSGTLAELSGADVQRVADLNIKLICDFRSAFEVESAPDNADRFGARYEPMPLDADHNSLRYLRVAIFQPGRVRGLMRESYIDLMLDRNAPLIGRFLNLAAKPENLPILFHCTAGKDRTGMAAMILLSLLGVPDDVIAADYSLSNRFYANFRAYISKAIQRIRWTGINVDDLRPMLIADPALMWDALASVREKYGSVEAYATRRCGVDSGTITALRALLLEENNGTYAHPARPIDQ